MYNNIYARPGEKLEKHLNNVSKRTQSFINNNDVLSEVGRIIGMYHDIGKATSFFQNYLKDNIKTIKSQHSLISAIYSAWKVQQLVKDKDKKYQYFPLIAYFSVLHHHGYLRDINLIPNKNELDKNFLLMSDNFFRSRLQAVEKQVDDMRGKNIVEDVFLDNWLSVLKDLSDMRDVFLENDGDIFTVFSFYVVYSSLIDADKKSSAQVNEVEKKHLPSNMIDIYKQKFDTKEKINRLRNDIYNRVMKKVETISLDSHILTFTAPTGAGKTLTSLSFALKLRERLQNERNIKSRIIYSLPFLSIIEQNWNVIVDILKQIDDFDMNKGNYCTQHYHTADVSYKVDNEYLPVDEAMIHIEAWDSELIMTTFVQLLYTIIGYKNNFLKKYHNLRDSIIILDEVQNIPIEYWNVVENIMKILSKEFNCYFILMTATKPLLFQDQDKVELLDEYENIFNQLNRIRVHAVDTDMITWFKKQKLNKSYLLVCNTKKQSQYVYEKLSKMHIHSLVSNNNLFYLSSVVIPKQRIERIHLIKKKLKEGIPVVLVSTQVVEAGVDLDFNIVAREIGPLESLIQVFGRCNRNDDGTQHDVYYFTDNSSVRRAEQVYGPIHIDIVMKLTLKSEQDFVHEIKKYFNYVKSKKISNTDIWQNWKKMCFCNNNRGVCKFQLYNNNNMKEVFIELDDNAKRVWKLYKEMQSMDYIEKKKQWYKNRKDFRSYIISVNTYYKLPPEECNIGYVSKELIEEYYDKKIGYKLVMNS